MTLQIKLNSLSVIFPCPSGGIGRRAGFKIPFLRECRFDSGGGHHFPVSYSSNLSKAHKYYEQDCNEGALAVNPSKSNANKPIPHDKTP